MTISILSVSLSLMGLFLKPLTWFFKRQRARRRKDADTRDPASINPEIDEALQVLAGSADGVWTDLWAQVKGLGTRPEIFNDGVPMQWIRTERAQEQIRQALHSSLTKASTTAPTSDAIEFFLSFSDDVDQFDAQEAYAAAFRFVYQSLHSDLNVGQKLLLEKNDAVLNRLTDPQSAPLIRPPKSAGRSLFSRMRYSTKATKFVERDTEQARLTEFVEDESRFAWWAVTGSGFAGKSRLALEFCEALPDDWRWGWLDDASSAKFPENWNPSQPTFIIVDYAAGQIDQIKKILRLIFDQQEAGGNRVRLLLLEREWDSWVDRIENMPIIAGWVADTQFAPEPLHLLPLESLGDQSNADDSEVVRVIEEILSKGANVEASSEIIGKMIAREFEFRSSRDDSSLSLTLASATMCGGFDTLPTEPTPELSEFLSKLSSVKEFSKAIGFEADLLRHQKIEPDVVGELYVLNWLLNESNSAVLVEQQFRNASTLNPQGFVNFWYRAAQSFPSHAAHRLILRDWAQSDEQFFARSAIIANALNWVGDDLEQLASLYERTFRPLRSPSPSLLFIEKAVFGKILTKVDGSKLEIIPGEIKLVRPATEVQNFEPNAVEGNPLASFLPLDYCNAIIATWQELSVNNRLSLLGPHFVECMNHKLVRLTSDRDIELKDVYAEYQTFVSILKNAHPNLYSNTIYAFQILAANLIGALVQFNRANDPIAPDFGDEIQSDAQALMTMEQDGQNMVLYSSNLEMIDVRLTVLAQFSQQRDFEYKLEKLGAIEQRMKTFPGTDVQIARAYALAAVQASSGFRTQAEAEKSLEILDKVRKFANSADDAGTATAFSMMLTNFARPNSQFELGVDSFAFHAEVASQACKFPENKHGITHSALVEIGRAFENAVESEDYELANGYLGLADEILEAAERSDYGEPNIFCAWIYCTGLRRYIDGDDSLFARSMQNLELAGQSSIMQFEQMLSYANSNDLVTSGLKAANEGDFAKVERCMEVLRAYDAYFDRKRNEGSIRYLESQLP